MSTIDKKLTSKVQQEQKFCNKEILVESGVGVGVGFNSHSMSCPWAEIVETTFRSRFRFRFLKYPLSKKVVSFRVPEI